LGDQFLREVVVEVAGFHLETEMRRVGKQEDGAVGTNLHRWGMIRSSLKRQRGGATSDALTSKISDALMS
jgi:hypothetical protein